MSASQSAESVGTRAGRAGVSDAAALAIDHDRGHGVHERQRESNGGGGEFRHVHFLIPRGSDTEVYVAPCSYIRA
jgi:hypothetical protein